MSKLKIAVIVDEGRLSKFGSEAIARIADCDEISVFSCTNTRFKRRLVKHGAYYLLNMLTVRNPQTRGVDIGECGKGIAETIPFETDYQGAWQSLPDAIVERLAGGGFDVILKFGTGLLRVPDENRLPIPILSFHHGDPEHFRGRPAGFYEIFHDSPVMGQIVQVLANKLDAGNVVAFAETKVLAHSYRATLVEAYRHSPMLIETAIRNARAGVHLGKPPTGRNYRLPGNFTVLRFVLKMAGRYLRRLVYGALFEKKWKVSLAPAPSLDAMIGGSAFPAPAQWDTVPTAKPYTFYADPFFLPHRPGLLVEALNGRTGLGEILLVDQGRHEPLLRGQGHSSYPMTIALDGKEIVLADTAGWAPLHGRVIEEGELRPLPPLDVEGDPRIIDPTMLSHEGRLYLFGNRADIGSNALFLWSADRLDAPFRLHPLSPIRLTPRGSRMAGGLVQTRDQLIRYGQDFTTGYGVGIFVFAIEAMSATDYRERLIGEVRFSDRRGPHTLNFRDGQVAFDWYRDRFDPLAGVRRLRAKARARQGAGS